MNAPFRLEFYIFLRNRATGISNCSRHLATDVDLYEKGYERVHTSPLTDIDASGHHGIDHSFKNDNGQYIICESKFRSTAVSPNSFLSTDTLDGIQTSDDWILGSNSEINRILEAVGGNAALASQIQFSDYIRVVSRVMPDGSIKYFELDSVANIIGEWTP